jgi:predicted ester cyclase
MEEKTIEQSTLTSSNDLSKTKITKEIIEKMVVALNDHRIDDIGEFFFNNFNWFGNYGCGTKIGLKEFQENWQVPFQKAFSQKVCIDEARLFEGEWGAAFGRQEAIHSGTFMGISPTNKKVEIRYMDFWQIKDNKIINNWVMVDFPDVLKQLGVDIFKGEGWEKFDKKNGRITDFSLDQNEIEDFIYRITEEIWENKKVENIRSYYAPDVIVRSPSITTYDCDTVVQATYKTLEQFPDRELIGEDVISFGSIKNTYLSSHRILSTGTHLGDGFYGKATGKKVIYRVIADCLVVDNQIIEEWIIRDEASILKQLGYEVRDFVEQRILDGTFKKNDIKFTKNAFIKKNIMNDCHNIYGKKYKDTFASLVLNKFSKEKKVYERSAQLYWVGGETVSTIEKIHETWNLFLSSFKILKCEISNTISLNQNNMRPRAALRWRLICSHDFNGIYGKPTNKEIEIHGISHSEFGKNGIVREYVLMDEISIWKQILL